ncbi:SH3 domain-containing protein [uncultured Roseobacter sp.]|uniref:SH3 domain-containing protein n=1 Tax=uncultured Roseobacter sp. TaxID=114847 RepID=UPI0026087A73|nr:SH3 domain-containing protein [uncultured Roseobacter sp.]
MKRFIFLSFGFLGFAFYEMSGGAEFDPVAARNAAVLARSGADISAQDIQTAQAEPAVQREEEVTRMSLNLTSLSAVLEEEETPTPTPSRGIAPSAAPVSVTNVTFRNPSDNGVVLPSIIFPGNTAQASSAAVTQTRDVRYVSGTLVNMRGGPGTGFDVVAQLNRNTEVEVLEDDGTGWVRLRPVAGGPDGWIADFLLTSG